MFGLNIKVTALTLINILVVQGSIYQEDRYLRDSNHVESFRRLYSDDSSDVFDKTDSEADFPTDLNIEDRETGLPYAFPGHVENNNEPDFRDIRQGFQMGRRFPRVFPVEDENEDSEDPFHFDITRGLPSVYPVNDNRFDQDTKMPDWFPRAIDNEMKSRPRWYPGGTDEGKNEFPISKPGRGEMKRKCRNIKGIPTPESGCCGVQMDRPLDYPNKRMWPQHLGRFTRSVDGDIPPSAMIRGGKATDLHQFPWMVRLLIDTTVAGIGSPKSCGGTIISSRYVLTAAHCLHGTYRTTEQLSVILAEYNSDTYPKDCNGQGCVMNQIRNVEQVIIHPNFTKKFLQNDVALLRLSSDINYSDFIRPVCLATKDITEQSEEPLIIAGWGLNGRTESNLKRSAIVNYVSEEDCGKKYSYKEDSLFCSIGANGEDICHGDSGGPLMVHSDGKFFLAGIVNGKRKDKECGSSDVPSLFNNVFYHLDWIKSNVE